MPLENEQPAASGAVEPAAMPGGTSMDDALADIAGSLEIPAEETGTGEENTEGTGDESAAGEPDPAGDKPAADKEKPGDSPAAAVDPNDKPPDTWRKEASEKWATVPQEVKAEIAKRENDIRQYVEGIKPHLDVARGLEKALAPIAPMYQRAGVNPWDVMPQVMNAYGIMQWGAPEQKVQLFHAMAKDMGVDISKLAEGAPDVINPTIAALQREIHELKSGVRSVTSGWNQQQQAKLTADVEAFASDPKNPHFYDVADEIGSLLKSGVSKTLQDAYERAIWSNPVTRAKAITAQQTAASTEAAKVAREKVLQAKAASAANVRARNSGGRAAPKNESIDDTLASTLAEIRAR